MDYFPLFLKLKQQNCLVIGAGTIAAGKIELLIRSGAMVTVIAEIVSPAVAKLKKSHGLIIKVKAFEKTDVQGFQLVIAATNHLTTNQLVADTATEHNIPVNVVDNLALCSFIFPAIIERSPIIVAISSGGASPMLARLLKAKIESIMPSAYGQLAQMAKKFRSQVKEQIPKPEQRRIFWEKVLQGSIAELLFAGKKQAAEKQLKALINNTQSVNNIGEVYLVGAGPGDPDLLTLRALRLMQQADVVLYDRLVSTEILALTRIDSEKIYVGKQRQNHSLPQDSINKLLTTLAKRGKRVVRLKGGDPFIFGRGGEEIETFMEQGINFQVVPGITAALGCASYAGIPLTHRDHAQSCTFVTGHLKKDASDLNWKQLALPNQTIVFYMGLTSLEKICQSLIKHGCSENHPIAIIQQGTTNSQRVLTGTLKSLTQNVLTQEIKAPTIIIVGTVVTLHNKLNWFKGGISDDR